MKTKEKVYKFRHLREMTFLPDMFTDEEAKEKLIEDALVRGYIPIRATLEKYDYPTPHNRVYCFSAYAGKKSARLNYESIKSLYENLQGQRIEIEQHKTPL